MITTDTGAKKIENSDNWRQIFDAHNDSVDAEDKIVPEMAPIVNGNKSTVGAAIGEYVLVRNSSITGITDGAYTAAKAIPANTTIDSTYLTAVGTGGALNALNSKIEVETLLSSSSHSQFVANQYVSNVSSKIFMQQARAYKVGHVVMMTLYFETESALADGDTLFTFAMAPLYAMSLGLFNGDHRIYQSKGILFGSSGTLTIKLNANIDADTWLRVSAVYITNS